uniref:ORF50 n=1 Tax=Panagrellus redivivus TaxID=6233 RepID=A0A7E4VG84_PANRE
MSADGDPNPAKKPNRKKPHYAVKDKKCQKSDTPPGIPRAATYDLTRRMLKAFCNDIPDDDYHKFAGLMACGPALDSELFDEANKTPARPFFVDCPEETCPGSDEVPDAVENLSADDVKLLLIRLMSFMAIGKVQSQSAVEKRLTGFLRSTYITNHDDLVAPLVAQLHPVLKKCNKAYMANIDFTRNLVGYIFYAKKEPYGNVMGKLCATVLGLISYAQMSIVEMFQQTEMTFQMRRTRYDPMFLKDVQNMKDTIQRCEAKWGGLFPFCKVLRLEGHEEITCANFPYVHAAISIANPGFAQPEPGTPAFAAREYLEPLYNTTVDFRVIMREEIPFLNL